MFDKRCRPGVDRGLRPVGSDLGKVGITANQLTAAGIVISILAGLAVAHGWLVWGVVLLMLSGLTDVLDGAVAKASGTSSPRGAFFDSVSDRVSDTFVLGGLAWYLASTDGGHAALLPFAVAGASNLISYERARAESLGFSGRGGLMERAERMVLLGIGLAFSVVLVPVLWVMLALTLFTAGHRFVMVWRQGSAPRRTPPEDSLRSRLRGWRPGEGFEPRQREARERTPRREGSRPASSDGSGRPAWSERRNRPPRPDRRNRPPRPPGG